MCCSMMYSKNRYARSIKIGWCSSIRFSRDFVALEEKISTLSITVGKEPYQSTIRITFIVVTIPSAYNTILERSGLNALKAVVSTYYLLVRFSTKNRVGEIQGDQMLAKQCFLIATKMKRSVEALPIKISDQKNKIEINKN